MMHYVSDLALALLKSTPSKVVLDIPVDEQISQNSLRRVISNSKEGKVMIYHNRKPSEPFLLYSNGEIKADEMEWVPGLISEKTILYGWATLQSYPEEFDPDAVKYHSAPFDIEQDLEYFRNNLVPTDDNNFATDITVCRALYNWLSDDQVNSSESILISRDTNTGLPPGDYVFRLVRSTRQGVYEDIPKVPSTEGEGYFPVDPYPDWFTKTYLISRDKAPNKLCWDPFVYSDFPCDMDKLVTVRISKSNWHSNTASVDDSKGKGRKVKNSKGQTTPSPAKG